MMQLRLHSFGRWNCIGLAFFVTNAIRIRSVFPAIFRALNSQLLLQRLTIFQR